MRASHHILVALLYACLPAQAAHAQTAMAQVRLATPSRPSAKRVPGEPANMVAQAGLLPLGTGDTPGDSGRGRNPYVGAQAGYVFGGGDFASNLVANGSVVYQVLQASGKTRSGKEWTFVLPVRGNASALVAAKDTADRNKQVQSLISGAQGMRLSVEPYLALPSVGFLSTGLFGSAGWKMNAVKDSADTTRYLALGRFAAGIQAIVGATDGSTNPILIELSPVYSTFAGRDFRAVKGLDKAIWSGELTIVIPVGASTGLLTEAIVAQRSTPVWRTGFVLTAGSK